MSPSSWGGEDEWEGRLLIKTVYVCAIWMDKGQQPLEIFVRPSVPHLRYLLIDWRFSVGIVLKLPSCVNKSLGRYQNSVCLTDFLTFTPQAFLLEIWTFFIFIEFHLLARWERWTKNTHSACLGNRFHINSVNKRSPVFVQLSIFWYVQPATSYWGGYGRPIA